MPPYKGEAMKKMARTVLFAVMAVFSTAVFAEVDPCAIPESLTEIDGVYQIGTCGELYKFAEMVNNGKTDISSVLTADICVNACGDGESVLKADGTLNGNGSNFKQWTPIGNNSREFSGTFNGNGHTISGLYFNNENASYVGLFGRIVAGAKIQNVGVEDSYIKGGDFVGGVVGYNEGRVERSYSTGSVGGNKYVGGVVGWNGGTVSNVYNTGVVSGTGNVGGVVGDNFGDLSNVYNTGTVNGEDCVGGVVGQNYGTVSNVYNAGSVSGVADVGGVVGKNWGAVSYGYYNKEFYTGNAVGENDEGMVQNVEAKKTDELASTTLPAGFSSEIWVAGSGEPVVSNGKLVYKLPKLKNVGSQPEVEYTGFQPNAEGYYEISTARELLWFAGLVNSGKISIKGWLTADICLNACGDGESVLKADGTLNVADTSKFVKWTPIGTNSTPYTGTFDGNGHTISGLYVNDENTNYVGFFGDIKDEAKIQNVGVEDSYFRGKFYVGGVVGSSRGDVSNVYNTGTVSGNVEVGGVVGRNDGTVSNVYNTGAVSGGDNVGGVVGRNDGTVSNVYNAGSVSGSTYVGGVVGGNGGFVSNAYYNTDAACENCGSQIEGSGKATAELAALDVTSAFEKSDGVWNAGYSTISNGWQKFVFPSLKGVGTVPTFIEIDPNATEVEISNADELFKFAEFVNAGNTAVNGRLTADICVNACGDGESVLKADGTLNGNGSNFKQWTPIGTEENMFAGVFDGNGHTISGLYFNNEYKDYVGLFGSIAAGAKIQNVGVVDSYIRGADTVGGVVGLNAGGTISNVYNTGAVSGNNRVGGVVGWNGGTVSNVYNTGAVSGFSSVGGVVGCNEGGTVSNVYNTGTVNGGEDCVVGGVVGYNAAGAVSNVYNAGSVSSPDAGGVVGASLDGSVTKAYYKTTAELAALDVASAFENSDGVWNNGAITISRGWRIYTLPSLKGVGTAPKFSEIDPNATDIEISSADELFKFAEFINAGDTTVNGRLTADICVNKNLLGTDNANVKDDGTFDVEAYKRAHANAEPRVWTPIGTGATPYSGTFDGRDAEGNVHTISGLYFNDTNADSVGLFGYIGENAKVQNVGVKDSYIRGASYVGGVVGTNAGTVSHVYNTGTVKGKNNVGGVVGHTNNYFSTVSNVYNTGAVSGGDNVGGVVGYIEKGPVSNVYNTGAVSGGDNVGGVVGFNEEGAVSNVYNTGTVKGKDNVGGVVGHNNLVSTVSNVYNTGAVNGGYIVGGVVGRNIGSTVSNVYNTGAVKGKNNVGGVVGINDGRVAYGYHNVDFYGGNAIGKNYADDDIIREVHDVYGKTTAELAALTFGDADEVDFPLLKDETESPWVSGSSEPVSSEKEVYLLPGLKNVGSQPEVEYPEFRPNADGYYEISTAPQLQRFADLVNGGATNINGRLTADIVVNENLLGADNANVADDGTFDVDAYRRSQKRRQPDLKVWAPINSFAGTFDGDGHTISGLYFNDGHTSYVGLFGIIDENANVQNVGVEDSYFRGASYVGGVVGQNTGTVSNVYNTGVVVGVFFTTVSGVIVVGGVVGQNTGTVSNVYNTGVASVYSEDVHDVPVVGGVVGQNTGAVSNVYNTGVVSVYSELLEPPVSSVVGDNSGTVSNSYCNTDVACTKCGSPGITGKTTAELVAGTSLKLDTAFWVVGGVGVDTPKDTLYYPYLKVFGPHKYVLGDVMKYTIAVSVNDEAMGTVTGAGEYKYSVKVELSAIANEGYRFTDWEDGVKNAVRTITVTKDETYTANFEAIPSSSSEVESSSSVAESSSSVDESSSSEAVSSSSEAKSSSSEAKSSSSDAESSSSKAASSSSAAESSSSEAASSSSEAKSSSSAATSSSSEVTSSSSEAESSSSEAGSSSSEEESSSSDAKSSSSQKESVIAQIQLPQFSVTASGKIVSIAGARPNSVVNVFDMQGNLVKTVVTTAANLTFVLPSAGVYIVKNGYTAKRVNVR